MHHRNLRVTSLAILAIVAFARVGSASRAQAQDQGQSCTDTCEDLDGQCTALYGEANWNPRCFDIGFCPEDKPHRLFCYVE